MKKTRKVFIIAFLLCVFIYSCKIDSIPNRIILYGGEQLNLKGLFGISFKVENEDCDTVFTSTDLSNLESTENDEATVEVKLFNTVKLKEVSVSIIDKTTVIPVGQVSGLKLYTNGVLVVGMSEIRGEDNQKYKPYENSGIEEGDRITKIDGEEVTDTKCLISIVNKLKGKNLNIEYVRNNEVKNCNITPIKYTDGTYKLGLWVRDSAAGIGTLTFYEPSTGNFAALGHGITDSDTGKLVEIQNGEFLTTKILSIIKGAKGNPGKIQGTIEEGVSIGTIYKNSNLGIYGTVNNLSGIKADLSKEMEVARRDEITLGEASIYCDADVDDSSKLATNMQSGSSGIKEYKIEIEKIFINNDKDNKSMLIKVKDQELLEKTGGIIQGMSGSPVVQNGKFIRSNYKCFGK